MLRKSSTRSPRRSNRSCAIKYKVSSMETKPNEKNTNTFWRRKTVIRSIRKSNAEIEALTRTNRELSQRVTALIKKNDELAVDNSQLLKINDDIIHDNRQEMATFHSDGCLASSRNRSPLGSVFGKKIFCRSFLTYSSSGVLLSVYRNR